MGFLVKHSDPKALTTSMVSTTGRRGHVATRPTICRGYQLTLKPRFTDVIGRNGKRKEVLLRTAEIWLQAEINANHWQGCSQGPEKRPERGFSAASKGYHDSLKVGRDGWSAGSPNVRLSALNIFVRKSFYQGAVFGSDIPPLPTPSSTASCDCTAILATKKTCIRVKEISSRVWRSLTVGLGQPWISATHIPHPRCVMRMASICGRARSCVERPLPLIYHE